MNSKIVALCSFIGLAAFDFVLSGCGTENKDIPAIPSETASPAPKATVTPIPTAIPTSTPTVDADVLEQAQSLVEKMVEAGRRVVLEKDEIEIWVAEEEREEGRIEIFRLIGNVVEIELGEEIISLLIEAFSVDSKGLLVVSQAEEEPEYAWDSERGVWHEQLRLGLPERVEDCQAIDSIDEILAVERAGFSFERDAPNAAPVRYEYSRGSSQGPGFGFTLINLWNRGEGVEAIGLQGEESGIKPVSCIRMEVEGGHIYLVGFALKNSNGTTSFIHTYIGGYIDGQALPVSYVVRTPEGFGITVRAAAAELFQELKAGRIGRALKLATRVIGPELVEKWDNQFLAKLLSEHPELDTLLVQALSEGKISPELEHLIIPLFVMRY